MAKAPGLIDEAAKLGESMFDQVGNAFQAFLYGLPSHTITHGTYQPDWFVGPLEGQPGFGSAHSEVHFEPGLPEPEIQAEATYPNNIDWHSL
jgi:hypothetical protein